MTPAEPSRHARPEPREIVELREIKLSQPELASAVDLQIALIELQRRVQARVPVPWIEVDREWLTRQQGEGRPLLRFEDIPLDWTDFRLMFRQTIDLLHRFEALEAADHAQLQTLGREGHLLEPIVIRWFNQTAAPAETGPSQSPSVRLPAVDAPSAASVADSGPQPQISLSDPAMLDQVLTLAMRPFLARCAEVVLQRSDFTAWTRGYCPLCGAEPEFAAITPAAERLLICGRCTARWRYDPLACPFCGNADRARITSFASRDGRYRIAGCDACRRYLKAYDGRRSTRPILLAVDSVATLPLDAAAMQKGYVA